MSFFCPCYLILLFSFPRLLSSLFFSSGTNQKLEERLKSAYIYRQGGRGGPHHITSVLEEGLFFFATNVGRGSATADSSLHQWPGRMSWRCWWITTSPMWNNQLGNAFACSWPMQSRLQFTTKMSMSTGEMLVMVSRSSMAENMTSLVQAREAPGQAMVGCNARHMTTHIVYQHRVRPEHQVQHHGGSRQELVPTSLLSFLLSHWLLSSLFFVGRDRCLLRCHGPPP